MVVAALGARVCYGQRVVTQQMKSKIFATKEKLFKSGFFNISKI